jgi:transposase
MASIERTAYPRFPRTLTLKDLQTSFTPRPEEVEWAQGFARTPDRRLALLGFVYICCNVFTSCFLRERNGMVRTLLSDDVWKKVEAILPGKEGDRGRTALDNRWFLEAVLWIGRTGSPWRDLPVEFGRWHTVYMRFSRWRRKGVWQRIALAMAGETEIEHILIDSTIVRAHQHSAGASKKVDRKRSDVPEVG